MTVEEKILEKDACGIFNVIKSSIKCPDGKYRPKVLIDSPNWVIAVIKNKATNNFVLVREFRYGFNEGCTECPCGKVEKGEDPAVAVCREVAEETGGVNPKIIAPLFTTAVNNAFMNNYMYGFYVEVDSLGQQHTDEDEFLDVFETGLQGLWAIRDDPKSSMAQKYIIACFENYLTTSK